MSVRALAQELYALEREVERLRHELKQAPPPRRDEIDLELLQATAERDRLRAVLRAKKEIL
ncbi:hypothetical protein [Desulfonatronum thioautotrophicum]|uniref:hypothetical protein n=1 Tax=Desulfonatronum thioautotrophicum TaxID=617001 RepID=UPI0005EB065C|nr:hypothetical protein [Desulfonatronum thioautotrophicum]